MTKSIGLKVSHPQKARPAQKHILPSEQHFTRCMWNIQLFEILQMPVNFKCQFILFNTIVFISRVIFEKSLCPDPEIQEVRIYDFIYQQK